MEKIDFGKHDPQVRNARIEELLRQLGAGLKVATPEGYGFMLMVMEYGEGKNCFYISSVQREDAIKMLEEMLEKLK